MDTLPVAFASPMMWASIDAASVAIWFVLTAAAALLTVGVSVLLGARLAWHARPGFGYGATLALLFVPFAIGSSVWAYAFTRVAAWSGLQDPLLVGDSAQRALVLLLACLARAIPLGIFFCATSLQRYTATIRPYLRAQHMNVSFFMLCALNRLPNSIPVMLGLFGGAMMMSEAALPTFLYRANPGTPPEMPNILLARLFREIYAQAGSTALPQVAALGMMIALVLFGAALCGTMAGNGGLNTVRAALGRRQRGVSVATSLLSRVTGAGLVLCLLPGIIALAALFAPTGHDGGILIQPYWGALSAYREIGLLGVLVGTCLIAVALALAVRLRYGQRDLLRWLETRQFAAAVLFLPAFVPILSVITALGALGQGQISGFSGMLSMFISHLCLHYPVFQFICLSLIAAIPERHVGWQRSIRMNYFFSLWTDGFRRHAAVLIGLLGMGVVLVVTDGSIARWFSHLVKAPEEALYAALFGRLSNGAAAIMVAWSIGLTAIVVCTILAVAFTHDLRNRPSHA